jgi:hypothetical protein
MKNEKARHPSCRRRRRPLSSPCRCQLASLSLLVPLPLLPILRNFNLLPIFDPVFARSSDEIVEQDRRVLSHLYSEGSHGFRTTWGPFDKCTIAYEHQLKKRLFK